MNEEGWSLFTEVPGLSCLCIYSFIFFPVVASLSNNKPTRMAASDIFACKNVTISLAFSFFQSCQSQHVLNRVSSLPVSLR